MVVLHFPILAAAPADRGRWRCRTFKRGPVWGDYRISCAITDPPGVPDREDDNEGHRGQHRGEPQDVGERGHLLIIARRQ